MEEERGLMYTKPPSDLSDFAKEKQPEKTEINIHFMICWPHFKNYYEEKNCNAQWPQKYLDKKYRLKQE